MLKKKVIVILILTVIITVLVLANNKAKKVDNKTKIHSTESSKRDYYIQVVPSVDQEYTIEKSLNLVKEQKVDKTAKNNIEIKIEDENTLSYEENLNDEKPKEEKENNQDNENLKKDDLYISEKDKEQIDLNEVKDDEDNTYLGEEVKDEQLEQEHTINQELKNGFIKENGNTYYYENNIKVTGIKIIDGINNYFSPSGKYLGTNNVKIIDVSYYQGDIDWDLFAKESDCFGVILRLGYYQTLDKKFEKNLNELKRLNIPYGIYLFSYSTTLSGSKKEANFTNNMINKYELNPTLGIYYDIESWSSSNGSSSNEISKDMYDNIVQHYINSVSYYTNYKFKVKVYSGRWYAMNRLGNIAKKYVDWVAEYNSSCKYDGAYSMWQYTSKGSVPGIKGNVDVSYIL